MTTRRRSRPSFRGRKAKQRVYWDQESFLVSPPSAGGSSVRDISHIMISTGVEPGGTCLRMVGNLNYYQTPASFEEFNIGIGVSIVTADALGEGSGAMPDPLTDLTHDWYYWHGWEGMLGLEAQHNQVFDIRSSRRLREGFRLVWISQNFSQEVVGKLRVHLRTLWSM